jgi:hypothetical protein
MITRTGHSFGNAPPRVHLFNHRNVRKWPILLKKSSPLGPNIQEPLMRLTPADTVDHVDLNRSFRRPSSSHEERILGRNLPPASFCENFVLAAFSTFSTESAHRRHFALRINCVALGAKRTSAPVGHAT